MQISVVLPVHSETQTVIDTISELVEIIPRFGELTEIVVVIAVGCSAESIDICERLAKQQKEVICFTQTKPGLGWAYREGIVHAKGSHILILQSDGESETSAVAAMIEAMERSGCDIVLGNRWGKGGGFVGYARPKLVLNFIFQNFMKIYYSTRLGDFSFAFRLYRSEWLKNIAWETTHHEFAVESLVKPLRAGAVVEQIPVTWVKRRSGVSKNALLRNFAYLWIALKVRMARTESYTSPPQSMDRESG